MSGSRTYKIEAPTTRRQASLVVVAFLGLSTGCAVAFFVLGSSRVASSGEWPLTSQTSPLVASLTSVAQHWNADSDQQLFRHERPVPTPDQTPDGALEAPAAPRTSFATVSAPGQLRCFLGHTDVVTGVAFAAGGRWVVSGSQDGTVRVWDASTGVELRRLEGHSAAVHGIAVAPDGRHALSGGGAYELQGAMKVPVDCTLRLWDLETGSELRRMSGHAGPVTSVAFSPDGRLALSGSHDRTVCLWNLESGRQLLSLDGHQSGVHAVAFCPDGRHALSAGGCDRSVRVWDLDEGREVLCLPGHVADVENVVPAAGGRLALAAGGGQEVIQGRPRAVDCTVRLWDLRQAREVRRFDGHRAAVYGLALSADERRVLAGALDGGLCLWDVETGQELARFTGHTDGVWCVALAADGERALSGGADGTVRLWSLPARACVTGDAHGS